MRYHALSEIQPKGETMTYAALGLLIGPLIFAGAAIYDWWRLK